MHDLLTKSLKVEDHICDLLVTFDILRKYIMKLNLEECLFGVSLGKVLCFTVTRKSFRKVASLDKVQPRNTFYLYYAV